MKIKKILGWFVKPNKYIFRLSPLIHLLIIISSIIGWELGRLLFN